MRLSGFIEPCLPSKLARPPTGSLWVHEIKHDRYRLMVRDDSPSVASRATATIGPTAIRRQFMRAKAKKPPEGGSLTSCIWFDQAASARP
jgi:hypothetical protein